MLNKIFGKSNLLKNAFTLMTGAIIAQAIPIAISPILTRLYSPDDFGVFALYLSITGIISVIATGRYELAIILPEKEEDAINLCALSIIIAFLISALILLIVWVFNDEIAQLLKVPEIGRWLYFFPITILLTGIYQSFNYLLNRNNQFKKLAVANVTQSSMTSATNVLAGINNSGPVGLIAGTLAGQFFGTSFIAYFSLKKIKKKIINYKSLKKVLLDYSDFPQKSSIGIFLNLLANQLPVIFIGTLYGSMVLGFYSLILKVLNIPLMIIGKSFSQAFFQESSRTFDSNLLFNLVKQTSIKLFIVIILPMTIIFFFGEEIFAFVFGEQWKEAGKLSRIFVIFYIVRFIFSSQSTLLITKRKMGLEIKFNLFFLITQLASLFIGYYYFESYYYSFLLMSISGFITFIILGGILFKLSRNN